MTARPLPGAGGVAIGLSGGDQIGVPLLVKQHHPDAAEAIGADPERILEINAAWELLGDSEARQRFDAGRTQRSVRGTAKPVPAQANAGAEQPMTPELERWLEQVYHPVDRLLGQVLDPFPAQLRELSADPYDDTLMEAFCSYLERSQSKLQKVETLYRSMPCPSTAQGFGLSVYHCWQWCSRRRDRSWSATPLATSMITCGMAAR